MATSNWRVCMILVAAIVCWTAGCAAAQGSLNAMLTPSLARYALPALAAANPIHLHVDLYVDPAKEQQMVQNYHKVFKPTISRQPGFVEVRLIRFREVKFGKPPAPTKYRLIISFQTEEQRTTWVASADHQKAWPTIEGTLTGPKFTAVLYDVQ